MSGTLLAGWATTLGSLPHADPAAAASFVLRHTPELPAAPQLPARSPREGMIALWARGIRGVTVGDDGAVAVDPAALDPAAPVDTGTGGDALVGTRAFLDAVAGRTAPVKVQLTGPVTLGLALVAAGADPSVAFPVAGAAVRAHAAALLALTRAAVPAAPIVAFLDEPGLTACVRPGFPLAADDTVDLLSGALASLESEATTGLHCCGPTDWRLAAQAGPRVLSLPATADALGAAPVLDDFLDRGGLVAWGAVPTAGPVGADPERLWRRLVALWRDLAAEGCDPVLLRRRALVTPACGLALHGVSQAARTLDLAAQLARRLREHPAARAEAGG